jgi:hypothetical protein
MAAAVVKACPQIPQRSIGKLIYLCRHHCNCYRVSAYLPILYAHELSDIKKLIDFANVISPHLIATSNSSLMPEVFVRLRKYHYITPYMLDN